MPYQGRLPYNYKSPYNTTLDQGTQTVPSLAFLGDTNNGLFSPATDNVAITTNGSEKLRVTDTGNVGIGTTNPIARLDVASGIYQSVRTYLPSITDTYHLYRGTPDGVGYEHTKVFSGRDSLTYSYGSYLAFYTEGKNSGTTDTSTERLRINSIGNVGIGTTNPIGVFHTRITTDRNLIFNTSIGGDARITALNDAANANVNFVLKGTDVILQSTGGVLRVASSGNVGIGTTNPEQKIHVNSGSSNVCFLGESSATNNTAYVYLKNATSTGNYRVGFGSTGDDAIIVAGGAVGVRVTSTRNLEPSLDATQDLGSSTKRWANIYSADLQLSNEGSSNDVDGTWGQYTIQEGENDLFLLNRRNGKKYKFVLQEVN